METETPSVGPLTELDKSIDAFQQHVGIPSLVKNNNVEKYLNFDFAVKLDPQEYAEASGILSQFAFYLQKQCNKEQSRIVWLKSRVNKIVAPRLGQQKGWGWEERRLLAVREDEVASKLDSEMIKCETRLASLNFLATKVENLAEKFLELSRVSRNRRFE